MLIYYILFCCISLTQIIEYCGKLFIGNTIYSDIVGIYTIFHSKYFINWTKFKYKFNIIWTKLGVILDLVIGIYLLFYY